MSSLLASYYDMFGWYHWMACSFLEAKREKGMGRGERGCSGKWGEGKEGSSLKVLYKKKSKEKRKNIVTVTKVSEN